MNVVIPAGGSTATITITPVDDPNSEGSEIVVLTLANAAAYNVGTPNTATVTILDNDAAPNAVVLAEKFDGVTAPALPNGWTTQLVGAGTPWRTVPFDGLSPPNVVFALGPDVVSDNRLVSPIFNLPTGTAQLSFEHGFNLEAQFDGGVLEISTAGAAFTDIIAAGGSFAEGGYTGTISTADQSPIAGRAAWTGDSQVNIKTVVNLPPAAAGKTTQLRWRLGTDRDANFGGWGIDNIQVTAGGAGGTISVSVTATDATAAEAGPESGGFTLSRTGATAAPLTVAISLGGTAVNGTDYGNVAANLVFPAGSATASVTIRPIDDTELDPGETVVLAVNNGPGYVTGAPASATITIQDNDGATGNVTFAENFDGVTAPILPGGWSVEHSGEGAPWTSALFDGLSAPNIVWAPDPEGVSDNRLVSPPISISTPSAQLSFEHGFLLEEGFDGGVLEIAIGSEPFVDILAAGGAFVEGGYNHPIDREQGSPIAGRQAWTGDSIENIRTRVNLPAAAAGQSIRLRWRCVSDTSGANAGWGLDNVSLTDGSAGGPTAVTITATDPSAAEAGSDAGELTLRRLGSTSAALTVNFTLSGSATSGADFANISTSATIPAGSSTVSISIRPINDGIPDADETVIITLNPGAGYAVGAPNRGTVTILDDDSTSDHVVFSEGFDQVTSPELPSGWNVNHKGAGIPWRTVPFTGLTPPNVAHAPNPETAADNALTSPAIHITTAAARLTFEHGYLLEAGYDGGVLEIAIAGGAFVDILVAGGSFVAGGYSGSISTTDESLIAGRQAWTGDSGVNLKTEVRLPANAAGQDIRLRWRVVTDRGVGGNGWGIDTVIIVEQSQSSLPLVTITATDDTAAEYGPDFGEFTLNRTGSTAAPLMVSFGVSGRASNGVDYDPLGTAATIPAGSSTVALRVKPINDPGAESTETVQIILQDNPSYLVGANNTASVSILDNGTAAKVIFAANFDDVTPPNLPAGWLANLSGVGTQWSSVAGSSQTPPNQLFAPDPADVSDNQLISPAIPITTIAAQLVFVHSYRMEPGYDGGVLEIAIGSDAAADFKDILAAGGSFVTGAYDGPLSLVDHSSIAGRGAWTGDSGGPKVTRVNLPPTAAGKDIRLRWRCASDGGVEDFGWSLDTVAVTEAVAEAVADLAISIQDTPDPVVAESKWTYKITVTNLTAVTARGVVVSNDLPANVNLLSVTVSQGTVSGTNSLVAQLGILNSLASASLTVVVQPAAPGTLNTTAKVSSTDADPNPANNAAAATTPVLPTSTPTLTFTNSAVVTFGETLGPAETYPSTVNVTGFSGVVGKVAVTLHGLSHTFPDDLDVLLVGPGGQKALLMSDAGGDQRFGISHVTLTFEEDASDSLPDRAEIETGSYQPTDFEVGDAFPAPAPAGAYAASLAVFNGTNPNGAWQLFMADDSSKDGGRLTAGWSLALTRAVANVTAPNILVQPQSQVVAAGTQVSFSVSAMGTQPLNYQWRSNGVSLAGATGATLTLNNVTPAQAGDYTVLVSNAAGSVISQPAILTVTSQARLVRLQNAEAAFESEAAVPVTLIAQGNENTVRFSINFEVERLRLAQVMLGSGAADATLRVGVNQLEDGRIGIDLSRPASQTFSAGEKQIVICYFQVLAGYDGASDLSFGDAPVARELRDGVGQLLVADYVPGVVTIGGTRPKLGAIKVDGNAGVQITLVAKPGPSYRLESSEDLTQWSTVAVLPNATGTVQFVDPNPLRVPRRYYRAVQLP